MWNLIAQSEPSLVTVSAVSIIAEIVHGCYDHSICFVYLHVHVLFRPPNCPLRIA